MNPPSRTTIALFLVSMASLAACAAAEPARPSLIPRPEPDPTAKKEQREEPDESTDPTAMHLHDVAGRLLMFVAKKEKLPAKLEDLAPLPGDGGKPSAVDPATGKPFLYTPDGLKPRGMPGRLIVAQSVSTRAGLRWVLLFNDAQREARVMRVADTVVTRPLD